MDSEIHKESVTFRPIISETEDNLYIEQLLKMDDWFEYFDMLNDLPHLMMHPSVLAKSKQMKKQSDKDCKEMDELWG